VWQNNVPKPSRSRRAYLQQAMFILSGMAVAGGFLVYVTRYDGDPLWLLAAALALLVPCGQNLMFAYEACNATILSLDNPIIIVLSLVLLLLMLPLLAFFFLATMLMQAARAPSSPGP
jgi:hypothetical protein